MDEMNQSNDSLTGEYVWSSASSVGSPLSHAAIVARELGTPGVIGCGKATAILRTGDQVRVDGGRGVVEILSDG